MCKPFSLRIYKISHSLHNYKDEQVYTLVPNEKIGIYITTPTQVCLYRVLENNLSGSVMKLIMFIVESLSAFQNYFNIISKSSFVIIVLSDVNIAPVISLQ